MRRFFSKIRTLFSGITIWGWIFLALLIAFLTVSSILEYRHQRNNILGIWRSQGDLLTRTIMHSGQVILASDRRLELSALNRLSETAMYFKQLDSLHSGRHWPMRRFMRSGMVSGIILLDRQLNSERPSQFPGYIHDRQLFLDRVRDLLQHSSQEILPLPPMPDLMPDDLEPGFIIRRSENRGALIVLPGVRPPGTERRRMGIQDWLNQIVRNPSILYVHLGSEDQVLAHSGILTAEELPELDIRPRAPSFWHIYRYKDTSIFEYAHIAPGGVTARIGLSTIELDHIQKSLVRRLIVYTIIVIGLLSALSLYTLKRQSLSLLQKKYQEIQTYSSAIIEEMDEGLIVLDSDGWIRTFNQSAGRILNITEPVQEQDITVLASVLNPDLIRRFQGFEPIPEFQIELKSGSGPRTLLISASDFRFSGQDHNDYIYMILIKDYTSQKELESLMRRRSKLLAMGHLASRVAHEIRNPLNGIGLLAQRLQQEYMPGNGNEEYRHMTRSIRTETSRINDIIETFLTYARTPELKIEPTSMAEFLEESLPLLESLGEAKGIKLELSGIRDVLVPMDRDQMEQVLINLVKNAVEASPDESAVRIKISPAEPTLHLMIEDDGSGITNEQKDKIFDLYYTTRSDGSGLGLSIVEKIVSAHGGSIVVESPYTVDSREHTGTRVTILLQMQIMNPTGQAL